MFEAVWTRPCELEFVALKPGFHLRNVSVAVVKLVVACSVNTPTCTTDCDTLIVADKIPVELLIDRLLPSILTPPRVSPSVCGNSEPRT